MVIVSYLDDLRAFNWWGNAKPVAKKLTQSHRWNEVEVLLEDVQIMTDTALNEYLAPSDRLDLFPIWEYTLIKDIMYEGVISDFIDEYMKKEQVE